MGSASKNTQHILALPMAALRIVSRMRTALVSESNIINKTMMKYPKTSSIMFTGLKTVAADLFTQKIIEGCDQINWRRNAVFGTFGFLYMGCFQYHLFNIVL